MGTTAAPDIHLREYTPSVGVTLTAQEASTISALRTIDLRPSAVVVGAYDLNCQSTVGVVALKDRTLRLEPKIPLDRLLFLISYALDPVRWEELMVRYGTNSDLAGAMAAAFASAVRAALKGGVLQGYRSVEEAAVTIRGRIRFTEQLRRNPGRSYPIEIRYDDFTTDIDENRIILAALWRLVRVPLRSASLRSELAQQRNRLGESVSRLDYEGAELPTITWTSLNRRYRPAVSLAKLVLRATTIEQGAGAASAAGFLVDMNTVFEEFVRVAMRTELGLSESQFPPPSKVRGLHLDDCKRIGLDPDLSWWEGNVCRLVGDVKYKRLSVSGIRHPDLYQLLSYVIATGLTGGLLVYPVAEQAHAKRHIVAHLGRRLDVMTVDVSGTPDDILTSVRVVAQTAAALAKVSDERREPRAT